MLSPEAASFNDAAEYESFCVALVAESLGKRTSGLSEAAAARLLSGALHLDAASLVTGLDTAAACCAAARAACGVREESGSPELLQAVLATAHAALLGLPHDEVVAAAAMRCVAAVGGSALSDHGPAAHRLASDIVDSLLARPAVTRLALAGVTVLRVLLADSGREDTALYIAAARACEHVLRAHASARHFGPTCATRRLASSCVSLLALATERLQRKTLADAGSAAGLPARRLSRWVHARSALHAAPRVFAPEIAEALTAVVASTAHDAALLSQIEHVSTAVLALFPRLPVKTIYAWARLRRATATRIVACASFEASEAVEAAEAIHLVQVMLAADAADAEAAATLTAAVAADVAVETASSVSEASSCDGRNDDLPTTNAASSSGHPLALLRMNPLFLVSAMVGVFAGGTKSWSSEGEVQPSSQTESSDGSSSSSIGERDDLMYAQTAPAACSDADVVNAEVPALFDRTVSSGSEEADSETAECVLSRSLSVAPQSGRFILGSLKRALSISRTVRNDTPTKDGEGSGAGI